MYLFTYNPLQNRTIICTDKMFVMLKWNVHEFILNLKQAENDEKHSKEFKTWCNDSRCKMNWTTTKKFLAVLFIEVKLLWYSKRLIKERYQLKYIQTCTQRKKKEDFDSVSTSHKCRSYWYSTYNSCYRYPLQHFCCSAAREQHSEA